MRMKLNDLIVLFAHMSSQSKSNLERISVHILSMLQAWDALNKMVCNVRKFSMLWKLSFFSWISSLQLMIF